jgi:hypothetical protein
VERDERDAANRKVRSSDGITFVRHFDILLPSSPEFPLGKLTIDGNYTFSSESGKVNYEYTWNPERLANAQRITKTFTYHMDTPALQRQRPDQSQEAFCALIKDLVQSRCRIRCDLVLVSGRESQPHKVEKDIQYTYDILDSFGEKVGQAKAEGAFYSAIEQADIHATVTFPSQRVLENILK